MDSSTGRSHQNGVSTQIPWIWCQKDKEPSRMSQRIKKHTPPGCLKMMQTRPRWHKEASDPSGMVCSLCRLLQYGTWKMQIPPGWQRMIKTLMVPDADPSRMVHGSGRSTKTVQGTCRFLWDSRWFRSLHDNPGRNRSFQNGRNADSPRAAQRLMTPTGPHREDVPSEVAQGTLCGSTD